MNIRPMKLKDSTAVMRIYADGIAGRNATFETILPTWETWDAKHLPTCRLVAEEEGKILGWVAFSQVSAREVYRGVVEESVYIDAAAQGKGVGYALLSEGIRQSEAEGYWMIQTSIFPENVASIKLHEKCGFRIVGHRERIAKLDGIWRSTVMLERRSQVVGND
jgi:L-amino acid N-acyltransferase YncA